MKTTGNLKAITKLLGGKFQIILEVNQSVDFQPDESLSIEIKKKTKGRSLNANAYFHELNDKLAEVNRITSIAQKNMLLRDYGTLDDEISLVIMRDDIDYLERSEIHLRPTSETRTGKDGQVGRIYRVIKGSHEYNTKEMSRLINGTVDECKQVGIETLTPDELHRMKGYE